VIHVDPAPAAPTPRGALLLLCVLLAAIEPALLAYWWSPHLGAVIDRGPAAIGLFLLRTLVVAFGMSAGLALWQRRPHAVPMTRLFLLASIAMSALTLGTRTLPGRPPPGTALPLFLLAAAYYTGWLLYLSLSERHGRQ
jgi:hypothetical protein